MNFSITHIVYKRAAFSILVNFLLLITASVQSQSILSEGNCYKMCISESGVYKIDYAWLNSAGITPSLIKRESIAVYSTIGGMLPQKNSIFRPNDPVKIPIRTVGLDDGTFGPDDYILFYLHGPDQISYNEASQQMEFERNIYSDESCAFISFEASSSSPEIETIRTSGTAEITIQSSDELLHQEQDLINILAIVKNAPGGSGRDWYGDRFDLQTVRTYSFKSQGITTEGSLSLTIAAMALSSKASRYQITANGFSMGELEVPSTPTGTYARKGNRVVETFTLPLSSIQSASTIDIQLDYIKAENAAFGYLDALDLRFKRKIGLYDSYTSFRSLAAKDKSIVKYIASNASEITEIWDVSSPLESSSLYFESTETEKTLTTKGGIREMIAFNAATVPKPTFKEKIEAQNLKGVNAPDFIILTHPDFLEQAERLAEFRRTYDGLEVYVTTVQKIYNEFSCGRQDLTALRDFIRHIYLKNSSKLKYVLLFGDTSFDYKDRFPSNTNFIPIYQSRESLNPIFSHSSDDYLAFMEPEEGDWWENSSGDHTLEIGIGRIPVRTSTEARHMVDKLIAYTDTDAQGPWKNKILFVADDGDQNTHQLDSERLAAHLDSVYGLYNIHKLYVDAHEQELTTNGKKSPIVRDLLNKEVSLGTFIVNYMGHGSETGWTSESILDLAQINKWTNLHRLPMFVTATCEFGRYDNPNVISGGETILLNEKGGGIALVTTTRPVFANSNYILAEAFYSMIFEPVNGQYPRLGDVIRRTKNLSLGVVNRNFALLGDPSMRLAYPDDPIVIRSLEVDGRNSTQLQALSKVKITAEIQRSNATPFEGEVEIIVYDKPTELVTLGDEATPMVYNDLTTVLYKGIQEIQSNTFTFEFIVPKDIRYTLGTGKISLYAKHKSTEEDASGYKYVQVGGTSSSPIEDNTPPNIEAYLVDRTFKNGQRVPSLSTLLIDLQDDTGINISGVGVGHDLVAILDDNESSPILLNSYYSAIGTNSKVGFVEFPMSRLEKGKHTLKVRAYDLNNQMAEKEISFVVGDSPLEVETAWVSPNPSSGVVHFGFTHNRAGDDLEILIQIYDSKGAFIRNVRTEILASKDRIEDIRWNGKDFSDNLLTTGVYFARISVRSEFDSSSDDTVVKVLIIH